MTRTPLPTGAAIRGARPGCHATLAAALCLLAAAVPAAAQAPSVSVTDAWARASIGASTTAAAYATLTGHGSAADQLTGASTPIAGRAQLHTDGMADGVMHMRAVDALPLPPGQAVTLAPGGFHLMLEQLSHPLHRGDTFPLTLSFRNAAPVTVQVHVAGPGATAADPVAAMPPATPAHP